MTGEIKLKINGKEITARAGETLLKIATDNGIDIPTLCYADHLDPYGGCGMCVVEAAKSTKLLRACSTVASDGMEIYTETERTIRARKIAIELLMSDHEGDCMGPCILNCPAHTDCQGYIKQIALNNDYEAVKIMKERLPIPASIGRICPHPCETDCRRGLVEEPLSIAYLKYFAADNVLKSGRPYRPNIAPPTGKSVGIIGGGPGGLSAAYFLATRGHKITIYDSMPRMGGMLRYGIPEYRLPKSVVDAEVAEIAALGVDMINNIRVGSDVTLDELKKKHDAVIVAIGAWSSSSLRCEGEDLDGVLGGIDFLREVALGERTTLGGKVAIIGGGNTAMDACRTAIRLGSKEVYVVYRRTRKEMPAEDIEIEEAIEEGVIFRFLANPETIEGKNGKVVGMKLQIMELGEPDEQGRRRPVPVADKFDYMPVDNVIVATGQKTDISGFEALERNKWGYIVADEGTFRTSMEGVFAIGDATNEGASIAIAAVGEAGEAAKVIDSYLAGNEVPYRRPYYSKRKFDADELADRKKMARARMPRHDVGERRRDFREVNLGYDDKVAREEAKRCLECGCHDFHECKLIIHANRYPIKPERLEGSKHPDFTEESLVVIERNQGKCITCGLCVRECDIVVNKGILGFVGRGFNTVIKPEFNDQKIIAECAECRKCVDVCPTGALRVITNK